MSFIDGMKNWLLGGSEEKMESMIEESKYEEQTIEDDNNMDMTPMTKSSTNNVVPIKHNDNLKVIIVEPRSFDDVTLIVDHLKSKRAVIANLDALKDQKLKKSVFDFMSGAVYIIGGDLQQISNGIYILAQNNVNIDSNFKKELQSKAAYPWPGK
ncbi:MAG: cell division protein SepF [Peptostreptococcaceae bacterium]